MLNKKLLAVTGIVLAGVALMAAYNRPFRWWPFNDMSEQIIIKPFNENSLLEPPEGSVSIDQWEPSPTRNEVALGEKEGLTNPIPSSAESVARGEELYQIYCHNCHGKEMSPNPEDQSPVQQKGMPGANILLVRTYSDAHIYAVLEHGNAIMKRVSYHLSPEERWHVINYIRSFQDNY